MKNCIKMFFVTILFAFITVSVAQEQEVQDPEVQNVITVPPNCPPGQEWINGMCRDIWSWRNNPNVANLGVIDTLSNRNVITVPTNCPPGQQLINGVCRDVWRFLAPTTPVPKNLENLELRDKRQSDDEVNVVDAREFSEDTEAQIRNIINIPNQCPIGYKPDALGICRQILL